MGVNAEFEKLLELAKMASATEPEKTALRAQVEEYVKAKVSGWRARDEWKVIKRMRKY